jgi:hypothetical protein
LVVIRYRWLERRLRRTLVLLLNAETRRSMAQFLIAHSAGATLWQVRGQLRRYLGGNGALT